MHDIQLSVGETVQMKIAAWYFCIVISSSQQDRWTTRMKPHHNTQKYSLSRSTYTGFSQIQRNVNALSSYCNEEYCYRNC